MITIIPNWHPIWVHFAIGLLFTGTLFYALAWAGRGRAWTNSALAAARWNLVAGALFALTAVLTGWLAANSVAHDDAAHANMLVHRNWALTATTLFVIAGVWLWRQWRRAKAKPSGPLLALLLAGSAVLGVTGYEGGQNVYEYGLGVQRLPDVGGHDHAAHGHGDASEDARADHHADRSEHPHSQDEADAQADEYETHDPDESPASPQPQTPAADSHGHDHDHTSHEGHAHDH